MTLNKSGGAIKSFGTAAIVGDAWEYASRNAYTVRDSCPYCEHSISIIQ